MVIPPLHIHHIGPFLTILAIRENTGRPGRGSGMTREEAGRNGEKWVETGRSGENNHPTIILARTGKTREDWEEAGAICETREQRGSYTGVTRLKAA